MKTKVLIFLLRVSVVVLLFIAMESCCSTKETLKTKIETKTEANLDVKTSNDSALNKQQSIATRLTVDSSKLTVDKSNSDETIIEESETTSFSDPDSTGKQHMTSKTNTKRTTKRGEQKNLTTDAHLKKSVDNKSQASDKSNYKSDTSVKDKGKRNKSDKSLLVTTSEIKLPDWVIFIISLAVGGVAFFLSKKFIK